MYLSYLLYFLWLLLAGSVIASPLFKARESYEQENTRSHIEKRENGVSINSKALRFGIEIETILKLRPDGPAHKFIQPHIKEDSEFNSIFELVRQYLVDEWNQFTPYNLSSEAEITTSQSEWLQEKKPKFQSIALEPKRFELVDRWLVKKQTSDLLRDVALLKVQNYQGWSITSDVSIEPDIEDEDDELQFPIEFVSPILEIGSNKDSYDRARYEIELLYDFLNQHGFEIVKNPTTSSHVHVSPKPEDGKWTPERTLRITQSALFFEPAIRSLMPPDRRENYYAREWRHPIWLAYINGKLTDSEEYPSIQEIDKNALDSKEKVIKVINQHLKAGLELEELIALMNPVPVTGKGTEHYWAWNFNNLIEDKKKQTIELRRGGQSTNASEAMFYIELIIGFSLAACSTGESLVPEFESRFDLTTGSLKTFIREQGSPSSPQFKFPELEKKFAIVPDTLNEAMNILKYRESTFDWWNEEAASDEEESIKGSFEDSTGDSFEESTNENTDSSIKDNLEEGTDNGTEDVIDSTEDSPERGITDTEGGTKSNADGDADAT